MNLILDFTELASVVSYSNTILSDKSVDDKMKNIIFLVDKEGVKIVGYNAFTFARTQLEKATVNDIPDDGWDFQLRASDINKIISSFSNLYKTKVDTLEISDDGVKVKVVIKEEPLKEEDSKLAQVSRFSLENAPIIANILKEIKREFPENVDLISSADPTLYIDSLLPLMDNNSSNNLTSKMNFAGDYVFVMSSAMSAFFENKLPDAFKDLTLSYSSVSFLNKLCEGTDSLGVARTDNYLCIQTTNTEAFMRYQSIKIKYQMYIDKRSKENGIVVDRMYFKDVLRRMGSVTPEGKMKITPEGDLSVVNEAFSQLIPLNSKKGEVENIAFNVSIPTIEKVLIGKDDVFPYDVFIYFVPTQRGYVIYLSDKTGAWFSTTQVTHS